MKNEDLKGRDISRPMDHIELNGVEYPIAFDMASMRVAEDVYELQYGRNLNFADIVRHLMAGKIGAIMAILYGALLSGAKAHGGEPMTWAAFADSFRLTSIPYIRDKLMKSVTEALPKAEGNEANPQ